jgi:hypothetical protein
VLLLNERLKIFDRSEKCQETQDFSRHWTAINIRQFGNGSIGIDIRGGNLKSQPLLMIGNAWKEHVEASKTYADTVFI